MIRKIGYSIFIICLFALIGLAQGGGGRSEEKKPSNTSKQTKNNDKPGKKDPSAQTKSKDNKQKDTNRQTEIKKERNPLPPTPKPPKTEILWTDDCDLLDEKNKVTDEKDKTKKTRCGMPTNDKVIYKFRDAINLLGKITYQIPKSKGDLDSYQVVIVNFCSDTADENSLNAIKEYLQAGGSAFILGGNICDMGGHKTSWWANQLTEKFGVTFTNEKFATAWVDVIHRHQITNNINKMYFKHYAYLNISGSSEAVLTINGQPIAAAYDGKDGGGAFVVLSDDLEYGWGPNVGDNFSADNIDFWKNSLRWLIERSKANRSKSPSANKSAKNPNSDSPAKLTVFSNLNGVKVFIDDVQHSTENKPSPYIFDSLRAGSYTIRIEKSGYQTQSRTITLAPNQNLTERFDLVAVDDSKTLPVTRVRIVEDATTKNEANSATLTKQYYDSGVAHLENEQFDLAITDFKKIIEIDSKYADAYFWLGRAYRGNKQYDLAIACFTKAIEDDANSAWAYNDRAFTYRLVGEVDKSITDAAQAIELDPKEAEFYHTRALAYSRKGETDLAISDYTKAIELAPDFYFAYLNRASIFQGQKDYDRVIADATKAIEIYDESDAGYEIRGQAYFAKQDYDRAIADFSKAIEINPQSRLYSTLTMAYQNRGEVYYNKKQFDSAITDFTKVIEIDPKSGNAYSWRGAAYEGKADYDLAIADYTKSIELSPTFAIAYNNRGAVYHMKKQYDLAITDFTKAIEIDPKNKDFYENRANSYDAIGRKDLAVADRQKAKELGGQ